MMIKDNFMGGTDAMIRTRHFSECNYKAVYFNGKTLRLAMDPKQDISELPYPEFYDVKITNMCEGGCSWCYQSSYKNGKHAENALEKINEFFGSMDENQRPFQVAIGGGEPTMHPDFNKILMAFYKLNITPNYTTNGLFAKWPIALLDHLLNYTSLYCGGVAISCHPHLEEYWNNAFTLLQNAKIHTNFHLIISDESSIEYFLNVYNTYGDTPEYYVLLPYIAQGRAVCKDLAFDKLFKILKTEISDISKIAFGAGFHPYLTEDNFCNVSLYDPEAFSKYLDLTDMKMYRSSFDVEEEIACVS